MTDSSHGIYSNLPKVMHLLAKEDHGDGALCPHCGAEGRFVYVFECEDGTIRAAMKGCYSHFAKSEFAARYEKLLDKRDSYAKKGWALASWDTDAINAIERMMRGEINDQSLRSTLYSCDVAKAGYMKRRGYRR